MRKTIDPNEWSEFLTDFSNRNRGRRSRFEEFTRGSVAEEDEEGVFESVSIQNAVVTISRLTANKTPIADHIENIHGIVVQYDTDGSENTIEFMNPNGDMTVLHFESLVDGDS
ncbi:MAG: hypothetical protein HOP17_07035 [Acidobacteria bacterium]|nr:hypothetical protein [Acidobacteriota bacterium]